MSDDRESARDSSGDDPIDNWADGAFDPAHFDSRGFIPPWRRAEQGGEQAPADEPEEHGEVESGECSRGRIGGADIADLVAANPEFFAGGEPNKYVASLPALSDIDANWAGREVPRHEYFVGSLFPVGGLCMYWGPPGGSKGITLLDALRILTDPLARQYAGDPPRLWGQEVLRIDHIPERVVWISVEEQEPAIEFRRRRLGYRPSPVKFYYLYSRNPEMRKTFGRLFNLLDLRQLCEQYDIRRSIIVCDSLTALRPRSVGEHKNVQWDLDNDANAALMSELLDLAQERGLCICLVHHTKKDRKDYRGAIAIEAALDVEVSIETVREGLVKIQGRKSKNSRVLPPFHLQIDHDDTRTSVSTEIRGPIEVPKNCKNTLLLLQMQGAAGATAQELAGLAGMSPRTIQAHLANLVAAGCATAETEIPRRADGTLAGRGTRYRALKAGV